MPQNELLTVVSSHSQHVQREQSQKTSFFNHFWGMTLITIGGIGCVLSSPLLALGGGIGYLTGLLTHTDPVKTGVQGAKVGSLGSLSLLLLGLDLFNAPNEATVSGQYQIIPESVERQNQVTETTERISLTQKVTIQEEPVVALESVVEREPVVALEPVVEHKPVVEQELNPTPGINTAPPHFFP